VDRHALDPAKADQPLERRNAVGPQIGADMHRLDRDETERRERDRGGDEGGARSARPSRCERRQSRRHFREEEREHDEAGDIRQLSGQEPGNGRLEDVVVDQQQAQRKDRARMQQERAEAGRPGRGCPCHVPMIAPSMPIAYGPSGSVSGYGTAPAMPRSWPIVTNSKPRFR
jgi:hypothetical protein